jgi:hypothetical protein
VKLLRFHISVPTLVLFFLFSCEKNPLSQKENFSPTDYNDTDQATPLSHNEIYPTPEPDAPKVILQNPPVELKKTKPEPLPVVVPEEKSRPQEPIFSEELLAVVKDWTKIPKSVFPARPVLASIPVDLIAKSSSGQVIATTHSSAGSELQVLGIKGNTLIVANANNSKLRGEVDIDLTDFKQLLAYRFELNQKKRAERQVSKLDQTTSGTAVNTPKPSSNQSSPKVEIPDPLDFGHGRFCICKDCRDKRLAKTGSLKTGFGLEP